MKIETEKKTTYTIRIHVDGEERKTLLADLNGPNVAAVPPGLIKGVIRELAVVMRRDNHSPNNKGVT